MSCCQTAKKSFQSHPDQNKTIFLNIILEQLKKIFVSKVVCKQIPFAIIDATTFHSHLHCYFKVLLGMYQQDCDFSTTGAKLAFEI